MIRISQCFRDQDLSVPRVDRLGVGSSSHNRWRPNFRHPRNWFVCRSSCVRWWAKPHSQVGVLTPKEPPRCAVSAAASMGQTGQRDARHLAIGIGLQDSFCYMEGSSPPRRRRYHGSIAQCSHPAPSAHRADDTSGFDTYLSTGGSTVMKQSRERSPRSHRTVLHDPLATTADCFKRTQRSPFRSCGRWPNLP